MKKNLITFLKLASSTALTLCLVAQCSTVFAKQDIVNSAQSSDTDNTYAATSCKTGFKPGKTPVSLVIGAKPKCVNSVQVAAGKKLLTGTANTCFVCHGAAGISPVSQMNSNLRAQGYTLAPADITAAFNAHVTEMSGATITTKDTKAISQYLQSIK